MELFYVENEIDKSNIDAKIDIREKLIAYMQYTISSTERHKIILKTIFNEIENNNNILVIGDTVMQMENLSKNIINSDILRIQTILQKQIKNNTRVFFCFDAYINILYENNFELIKKYNINVLFDISYKTLKNIPFNTNHKFDKFIMIYDNYYIGKHKFAKYNNSIGEFKPYNQKNKYESKDLFEFDDLIYL